MLRSCACFIFVYQDADAEKHTHSDLLSRFESQHLPDIVATTAVMGSLVIGQCCQFSIFDLLLLLLLLLLLADDT
jgi:hypothetical protein